jgi:hypothetical protein
MFKGDGPLAAAEREAIAAEQLRQRQEADAKHPLAEHWIKDGRAVCLGDSHSRCHFYPGCECEEWSDDHEHASVEHDECWMIPWIDSTDLEDSAYDDAIERRDPETVEFPDGEIEPEWEGEFVIWNYVDDAPVVGGESE